MGDKPKRGGAREGAGRKSKDEELKIIERLDNIIDSDEVIESLKALIKEGNFNAIKLYLEYRYGKPKETIETTHNINDFNIKELFKVNDKDK